MNHEQAVARNHVGSFFGCDVYHGDRHEVYYGSLLVAYLLCVLAGLLAILIPGTVVVALHFFSPIVGWVIFALLSFLLLSEPLDTMKRHGYVSLLELCAGVAGITILGFVMWNLRVTTTTELVRATSIHVKLF